MAKAKKETVVEAPVKCGRGKAKEVSVEEVPVKKGKGKKETAVEEAPVKRGRGRQKGEGGPGRKKGVRNEVTAKEKNLINDQFESLANSWDSFSEHVEDFIEKGNKSAAMKARKELQLFIKQAKDVRKSIQDAKQNMKQVAV
jgi:hypothetical protein